MPSGQLITRGLLADVTANQSAWVPDSTGCSKPQDVLRNILCKLFMHVYNVRERSSGCASVLRKYDDCRVLSLASKKHFENVREQYKVNLLSYIQLPNLHKTNFCLRLLFSLIVLTFINQPNQTVLLCFVA